MLHELPFEAPMSPLREPFSPVKADQMVVATTIAVQDQDDEIIETIPLGRDGTMELSEEDPEDSTSSYSTSSSPSASPAPPLISLTSAHLAHLNARFEDMEPQDVLRVCKVFFPGLYQTTAFGLSGLVILDMLSKIETGSQQQTLELIFLDTLHHFPETLELVDRVRAQYPLVRVHRFRPIGCETATDFAARYGERLWESDSERYDFLAKVEPQQRADMELDVSAVITGRRRSQGGERAALPVVEIDTSRGGGIVKINPLARWSFEKVREYVRREAVPYNSLLDRGYRSVGDWHSTQPVADNEDERAGRWAGQQKTECGIHNSKSRYAMFLAELAKKEAEANQQVDVASEEVQPEEAPARGVTEVYGMVVDSAAPVIDDTVGLVKSENSAAATTTAVQRSLTTSLAVADQDATTEPVQSTAEADRAGQRVGFRSWSTLTLA
ncbi:hypothetical protein DL764_008228 [Monosporascus ibericus]|uniref:Phosphoadenosine phosphosulphate reductase domain-containing protein n=1 Tax=Monosporascus ibericus TaxID=155417 RepID=A0A4Q4T078_9PEZI|nr:hypothetical protein DL764_008228 [Monosporascus ibericus]